jgi:hypothetical protein
MTTVIEFDCPVRFFPMTTAERDAMVNKPEGLIIHNTTTEQIEIWLGDEWNGIQDGHGALVVGNDPDCYLEAGGTSVLWYVDEGDFLAFVRGSNAFTWNIDSIVQASLSGTVLTLCHHFIDLRGLSSSPEPIIADAGNLYCKGSHLYWWGMGQAETDLLDHHARHEGGADAMTVDAAAATGSLRTLGTAATAACAGNDSRLSDARTPTAHDLAGALHNAATLAALNDKISDADIVPNTLFDAQTILVAVTDNTPVALTVAEQRLVGRITGGNIAALTAAQIRTLLTLPTYEEVTITIPSPVAADDFTIRTFDAATTLFEVASVIVAGTNVVFNLYHGNDRSAAGTKALTADVTENNKTTGTVTTGAVWADATLNAGDHLRLKVVSVSGTVTEFSCTVRYFIT